MDSWSDSSSGRDVQLPSADEIRQLAYERWLGRGRRHGQDREDWVAAECELIFSMNYRTIAEYQLEGTPPVVLGDDQSRYCRFCERSSAHAAFGPPFPLLAGGRLAIGSHGRRLQ